MNDQLESRLRRHLRSLDAVGVTPPDSVGADTRHVLDRRRRARRSVMAGTSAVIVLAAGAGLWWIGPDGATQPELAGGQSSSTVGEVPEPATLPPETLPPTTAPLPTAPAEPSPPETGSWRSLPPDPRGRSIDASVVWTGTEALVVGGRVTDDRAAAGASAYDPATDTWRLLASPMAAGRVEAIAAWTGDEMLVVGGEPPGGRSLTPYAEAYDPTTDSWRPITPPSGIATEGSPWVWTGTELLVWAAPAFTGAARPPAAYDPATDTWRTLAGPPIAFRESASSVWTGSEWIVWGGVDEPTEFADGAAYDPATDTWRTIAESPLSPRKVKGVWTGSEMLLDAGWSGTGTPFAHADGAAYDPVADTWRSITPGLAHPGFEPIFTGQHLLLFAKGGVVVYDVAADRWVDTCCSEGGATGTAVWTGTEALVIGSWDGNTGGAAFTPPAAAVP